MKCLGRLIDARGAGPDEEGNAKFTNLHCTADAYTLGPANGNEPTLNPAKSWWRWVWEASEPGISIRDAAHPSHRHAGQPAASKCDCRLPLRVAKRWSLQCF
ncbi:sulfatase [Anopheles sinensis]|uniref:Sulfatase n=1 Tax=Anopheles sinensis TaxID=74873 RepID=A0A084WS63_ANOSI|nr:sulfatase [Anopheles sinensis]